MARITAKEITTAKTLAARKTGVTIPQLTTKLKISYGRARMILKRTKVKAKPVGKGRMHRVLVYTA